MGRLSDFIDHSHLNLVFCSLTPPCTPISPQGEGRNHTHLPIDPVRARALEDQTNSKKSSSLTEEKRPGTDTRKVWGVVSDDTLQSYTSYLLLKGVKGHTVPIGSLLIFRASDTSPS